MKATILFQYPEGGLAESAKAVVTAHNLRVNDRVCAVADVERAQVQRSDTRWFRIFTIFGSIIIGVFTIFNVPLVGVILLGIGGLLFYTTASRNKWSYWDGVVVMRQTEETVMGGDPHKRFCILVLVEKHIAEEFVQAVQTAVAENGSEEDSLDAHGAVR